MTGRTAPAPEFSHVVRPSELPDGGARFTLEASPAEREALARRFGLEALEAFSARIALNWVSGGAYLRLRAGLCAEVVQSCVVTLEPVPSSVDREIEIFYAVDPEDPETLDSDPERDIEMLDGDSLDIGEIVAEELALMLDPYPRAPGAALDGLGPSLSGGDDVGKNPAEAARRSPFEVLAGLKGKQ
jgi:uncharacterized metal-binding protein YceD (DUF177 family)